MITNQIGDHWDIETPLGIVPWVFKPKVRFLRVFQKHYCKITKNYDNDLCTFIYLKIMTKIYIYENVRRNLAPF